MGLAPSSDHPPSSAPWFQPPPRLLQQLLEFRVSSTQGEPGSDQPHSLQNTRPAPPLPPKGKAPRFWNSIWGPSEPDPGLPSVPHLLLHSTKLQAPLSLDRLALPCLGAISAWNAPPFLLDPQCFTYLSPKLQIPSSTKWKDLLPPLGTHRTLLQAFDATCQVTLLIAL